MQSVFPMKQIIVSTSVKQTAQKRKISSDSKRCGKQQSVYEMYYDFEEPVKKLAGHRVLALNRGEKEKFLTVKIMHRKKTFFVIWRNR